MLHRVEKFFNESIRPALEAHGGNMTIVDLDNQKLFVQLEGACQGCAGARATLKEGVERMLKQKFPEIKEVVDMTDHASGKKSL